MYVTRHVRSPGLGTFGYAGGDLIPREDGVFALGSENNRFKELWVEGESIHLGTVEIIDEDGCLGSGEFHAHGRHGVSGYIKLGHGTTPSAHKEAGHSIVWIDSSGILLFEKPDGSDYPIITGEQHTKAVHDALGLSHASLSDVLTDDHHAKYTDAEAIAAVESEATLDLQGVVTVDVNNAEALLVRKDGDGGDVFIVDTVNTRVGIGVTPDDWLHIFGNNAAIKLEDDSGNYARINVGESQLTLEVDPDNVISSTDMVFKMDGEEVARFLVGGQFRSLESINAKEGFATRLWDISGEDWDTTPGVNTEYYSPNQHGGIYGIVYRQYFTTTLPSSLTSGSNVSKLVDYNVMFKYTTANRGVSHGMSVTYTASEYRILIILSGASGSGNISWDNDTYTPIEGWVDYTK